MTDGTMLKTTPWKHQQGAIDFASDKDALLNMGMGTGKSLCAIAKAGQVGGAVLIVCPVSVMPVWSWQFDQHAAFDYEMLTLDKGSASTKAQRVRDFVADDADSSTQVVVVNYESAWRGDLGKTLLATKWELIIADESHRIKTPGSKVSKYFHRLGRSARQRLALTGTPMPHSPLDIYSQMKFVNPFVYGTSFVKFRAQYAIMGGFAVNGRPVQITGYQNQDEMARKMDEVTFSAKSEDVLDLPPATFNRVHYKLDPAERVAYEGMERDFVTLVKEGIVTAGNALTKLLRLQQIVHGVTKTEDGETVRVGNSRAKLLKEVLENLGDEPVAVVCLFKSDIEDVRWAAKEIGNRDVVELSGERKDIQGVWNKGDIAAVQIRAGGLGVDLTRARYCVLYGVGFSMGDYDQVLARVHRPGQTRPVTYIQVVGDDTMDAKVYEALAEKKNIVGTILDQLEGPTKK